MAVSLFNVLDILLFYCCQIHQPLDKGAQKHLVSVKIRMLRNAICTYHVGLIIVEIYQWNSE
jgi:hypothetical protein